MKTTILFRGSSVLTLIFILFLGSCKKSDPDPKPENSGDFIRINSEAPLRRTVNENVPAGKQLNLLQCSSNLGPVQMQILSQVPENAVLLDSLYVDTYSLKVDHHELFDYERFREIRITLRATAGDIHRDFVVSYLLTDLPEPVGALLDSGLKPWEIFDLDPAYGDSSLIGIVYGGGFIYHHNNDWSEIWIVNKVNIGPLPWGCKGLNVSASGGGYHDGLDNTNAIATECNDPDIAARACLDVELDGYTDWYLPSRDEWTKISSSLGWKRFLEYNIFYRSEYWTSTQRTAHEAYMMYFSDGEDRGINSESKSSSFLVKPVRLLKE